MTQRRIPYLLLVLALLLAALPASFVAADGTFDDDNVIENEYGATRAIDGAGNDAANGDSEVCAVPDGNRGNLMELHAYNATPNNEWYFAFVVDSSHPLDVTTGDFFGKAAGMKVNYILGIDVGCNGGAAGDMNASTPWKRYFSWQGATYGGSNPGVDYFIATYPTGNDTMNGQLYSMNGSAKTQLVSNISVDSRVVDNRRHVEFALPSSLNGLPADLKANSQLCLALITTEDTDTNSDNGQGGRVLDDLGSGGSVAGCDLRYRLDGAGNNGPMPIKIDTQAYCQVSGRPMPGGSATRQCTSFPARSVSNAVDADLTCTSGIPGVAIDGNVETTYTVLTEAAFAAPYAGGDSSHSDFGGESSAYSYWTGSAMATYAGNADVHDVHAQTDSQFLYLDIAGPGLTAFGGAGQMSGQPADDANLFIAIDMPNVTSNTDSGEKGGGPEAYTPPNGANDADQPRHPGNRKINFRGWDPDYIVEMIWAGDDGTLGAAKLWKWNGSAWADANGGGGNESFKTVETVGTSPSGVLPFTTHWHATTNTPPTATSLYFGRQPTSYEFAIPWVALGGQPGINDALRIGVYTTRNPDGWDINDQAPGIGQGANGLGSHERIGDLPDENDNESDPTAAGNDRTPYVGRTHGQAGRAPGSDDTGGGDTGNPNSAVGDSDTIEEYFLFKQDPVLYGCPLAVALASFQAEAQADHVLVSWETVSEIDNRGFNLYRGASPDGWERRLNATLIPSQSPGNPSGFSYTWLDDADLTPGATYYYWLEDMDVSGVTTLHGPVSVDFVAPTAVTLDGVTASPAAGAAALPWLWVAVAAGAALALGRRR